MATPAILQGVKVLEGSTCPFPVARGCPVYEHLWALALRLQVRGAPAGEQREEGEELLALYPPSCRLVSVLSKGVLSTRLLSSGF